MSDPPSTDQELALRACGGCKHSFGELVGRHHGPVFGFLLTITRHRHDAEDLTQETFLRAWRKLDLFDPSRPLLPWLFAIARNLAISASRKMRAIPVENVEALIVTAPEMTESPPSGVWQLAERRLDPSAFTAMCLHYRDDLPLAEIGSILGKSEGAIKVLLHRARKKLAIAMQESVSPVLDPPAARTAASPWDRFDARTPPHSA